MMIALIWLSAGPLIVSVFCLPFTAGQRAALLITGAVMPVFATFVVAF